MIFQKRVFLISVWPVSMTTTRKPSLSLSTGRTSAGYDPPSDGGGYAFSRAAPEHVWASRDSLRTWQVRVPSGDEG